MSAVKSSAGSEFGTIELGNGHVRYLHRTSGSEATPLLVCNGLGQSIEVLLPLLDELQGRNLIVIDMPGVGRSEMLPDVGTIPEYAAFTFGILDQLNIKTVDILGISWGGALAQQMAHMEPNRVQKLVLSITSAGGIGSWWGTPIALSEIMFPLRYMSKTYGNFVGPLMYGGEAISSPGAFKEYSKHAIAPSPEGYFSQVRAMCNWTSLPWLRQLTQPVLIIAGKYDGLIPIANQLLLANMIPDARLQVYSAGHLLMYTRRHEVGPLISGFLET